MPFHSHTWSILSQGVWGYFSKRDVPNDPSAVPAKGTVFKCAGCGKTVIKPNDPTWQIVEVEPEQVTE